MAEAQPFKLAEAVTPEAEYWYSYGKRSVAETAFGFLCYSIEMACLLVVLLPIFISGRIAINIFTCLVFVMGVSMFAVGVPRLITGRSSL
jgi:hypothetical protein